MFLTKGYKNAVCSLKRGRGGERDFKISVTFCYICTQRKEMVNKSKTIT
jgi:hypothetical protein